MLKVEWFGCLRGGDPTSPSNNRVTNSCRKASNKKKKKKKREREREGRVRLLFGLLCGGVGSPSGQPLHVDAVLMDAVDAPTR